MLREVARHDVTVVAVSVEHAYYLDRLSCEDEEVILVRQRLLALDGGKGESLLVDVLEATEAAERRRAFFLIKKKGNYKLGL